MKLTKIILAASLFASSTLFAAEGFMTYKDLTKKYKAEDKQNGMYATTAEVKAAIQAKDWAVVDVRTLEEWAAGFIKGTQRVGREAPEKALESIVLDDDDKFVKPNLIVVCNTASRASIEARTFRDMGFKTVKIYDMHKWIDECNPVVTKYSLAEDKTGTKNKFGAYYAEHCKK